MKQLILGCLCLLLFACTANRQKEAQPPVVPISSTSALEATQYYNLAEFNYQQKKLNEALDNLRQAEALDPSSVAIRNRITEILLELAMDDSQYTPQVIQTATIYYQDGFRSKEILASLADAYFLNSQPDQGIRIFRELIQIDPSALNLYKFYLLQYQYADKEEPELLERALEKSWDNERLVLLLAGQLKGFNPLRAEEIMRKAWHKWQDDQALVELVNILREEGKSQELIDLLIQLMEEERDIYGWMRETLLRNIFALEKHETIVENYRWFLDSQEDLTDTRILIFWAAEQTDADSLLVEMCDQLVDSHTLTMVNEDRYLSVTAGMFLEKGDVGHAAQYLSNIHAPAMVEDRLILFLEEDEGDSTHVVTQKLIDQLQTIAPDDSLHALLMARQEAELNPQASLEWLNKIDHGYILRNDLTLHISQLYVTADQPQPAIEAIRRDSTLYFDPEISIGLEYNRLERYDKTIEYLEPYLRDYPDSSIQAYNALSGAYYFTGAFDKMIQILRQGVKTQPENAMMHNDLAYQLAEMNTDLEQALVHANRALELSPDSADILDTAGWVHYHQGDFKKALKYLEQAIAASPGNTSIAYHAGEVYRKLGKDKLAKESLQNAVLFDTNDNDKEKARRALKEYYGITLEEDK